MQCNNNNYGKLQVLFVIFKFPMAMRRAFFKTCAQYVTRPHKKFACPGLDLASGLFLSGLSVSPLKFACTSVLTHRYCIY